MTGERAETRRERAQGHTCELEPETEAVDRENSAAEKRRRTAADAGPDSTTALNASSPPNPTTDSILLEKGEEYEHLRSER